MLVNGNHRKDYAWDVNALCDLQFVNENWSDDLCEQDIDALKKRNSLLIDLTNKIAALDGTVVSSKRTLHCGVVFECPSPFLVQHSQSPKLIEIGGVILKSLEEYKQSRGPDFGGHLIVPQDSYTNLLDKNFGVPHPFAGRYHPIIKCIVPPTSILFYTPSSTSDVDRLFAVFEEAYHHARDDC